MPHTLNVYLVEDSRLIRDSLIAALEEMASVRVVGWSSGERQAVAALRDWQASPLDLVLIDLMLDEGSGLGVLRTLRGFSRQMRCVVLSNYATADMRRECLQLGALKVFDKSSEIDALMDFCLHLLDDDEAGPGGATAPQNFPPGRPPMRQPHAPLPAPSVQPPQQQQQQQQPQSLDLAPLPAPPELAPESAADSGPGPESSSSA